MNYDILILGTPIHNYTKIVSESFAKNSKSIAFEIYKKPNHFIKSLPIVSWWYGLIFNYLSGQFFSRYLGNPNLKYDTLIIFGFNSIPRDKLLELKKRKKFKILLWFVDSITAYKGMFEILDISDYIICYNKHESIRLNNEGHNSIFLPLAYDDQYYYPIRVDKKYDLCFIGTLKSRIPFFEELLTKLQGNNYRIRIQGRLSPLFVFLNRKKYPLFFKSHINKYCYHNEINEIYNRSRICLNNQPSQALSGFSIRTFEICGASGFQITNGNKDLLSEYFEIGKEIEFYSDIEELANKLKFYLLDENENKLLEIASCGYRKVLSDHTFEVRIKEILDFIS